MGCPDVAHHTVAVPDHQLRRRSLLACLVQTDVGLQKARPRGDSDRASD